MSSKKRYVIEFYDDSSRICVNKDGTLDFYFNGEFWSDNQSATELDHYIGSEIKALNSASKLVEMYESLGVDGLSLVSDKLGFQVIRNCHLKLEDLLKPAAQLGYDVRFKLLNNHNGVPYRCLNIGKRNIERKCVTVRFNACNKTEEVVAIHGSITVINDADDLIQLLARLDDDGYFDRVGD